MPLTGTRDLAALAAEAPLVRSLDAESVTLPGAQILQVIYEIDDAATTSLIPMALHPTIPPVVYITVTRAPESPWGAFTLAEVRAGCRSGARPRALLARAYCDSEAAVEVLRNKWGYPVVLGAVTLAKRYDADHATVETAADGVVLDVALMNPEAIGPGDVQYISSLHVARILRDGAELTRLIQVDPEYVFHTADRGKPLVSAFRAGAWGLEGALLSWPVSASFTRCDITMPTIRYLVDPAKPVMQSVERI
ncbi:MAG: acetoacetate decarboxylase family protein [Dehalococcoidia bacterium]